MLQDLFLNELRAHMMKAVDDGTGCANCKNTLAPIDQPAEAKGLAVTLTKAEDLKDIKGYGVMSTLGVVINGKVVHAGGVPSRDKIDQWLTAA